MFELEVLGLHEIESEVSKWTGVEGVIIRMVDGMVLKAKSLWWRRGESKEKRRWHSLEAKQQARKRRAKRRYHMETESQRVVLRGWNHWVHPSRVFSEMASAEKVDFCINRGSTAEKVDFCINLFEEEVPVASFSSQDDMDLYIKRLRVPDTLEPTMHPLGMEQ